MISLLQQNYLAGADYIIHDSDLTVTFPAGEPVQRCITVQIVNDTLLLEGDEMFELFFDDLPQGVVPGDNPEVDVTIREDDSDRKLKIRS